VVLGHVSETNNHPELAAMSAESALRRRSRPDMRLELAGRDGTDWIDVGRPRRERREDPGQLRLW
jgi:hypothetical protein